MWLRAQESGYWVPFFQTATAGPIQASLDGTGLLSLCEEQKRQPTRSEVEESLRDDGHVLPDKDQVKAIEANNPSWLRPALELEYLSKIEGGLEDLVQQMVDRFWGVMKRQLEFSSPSDQAADKKENKKMQDIEVEPKDQKRSSSLASLSSLVFRESNVSSSSLDAGATEATATGTTGTAGPSSKRPRGVVEDPHFESPTSSNGVVEKKMKSTDSSSSSSLSAPSPPPCAIRAGIKFTLSPELLSLFNNDPTIMKQLYLDIAKE